MDIPIFLIFFIGFVICLAVIRLVHSHMPSFKDKNEIYLNEDREANFARTTPIPDSMIKNVTEAELPFKYDYDESDERERELFNIQNRVLHNLKAEMIKTSQEDSNIDLKLKFGAKNLERIIYGEENFTKFIQNMNGWAKRLIDYGNKSDAEAVLRKSVQLGSDISETYILLYCLLKDEKRDADAELLIRDIEQLPEICRELVYKSIGG